MRRFTMIAAATCIAFGCVALPGCKSSDEATTRASASMGALCDCGYEKGSSMCCNGKGEICTGCNKYKGSPGCCK